MSRRELEHRQLEPAAEQAIDWMIALRGAQGGAQGGELQRQRFEQWHAADPRHAQAWACLQERIGAPYERLRALGRQVPGHAQQAREVLLEPLVARRTLLRGLGALSLLGGGAWLGAQSAPGQALLAAYQTGSGERRHLVLPDGSQLTLNACSAVDLRFNARERCVILRRGELVVEVAADARPFSVLSAQAAVAATATGRWLVSQEAQATVVLAMRGSLEVGAVHGNQVLALQGSQAARVDAHGIHPLGAQPHRADWLDGVFSAIDEPLQTVVEALRAYRPGIIRLSADARSLRVQGVFALDRPDQALQTMAQTLPVRIDHYGPWLVLISRRV